MGRLGFGVWGVCPSGLGGSGFRLAWLVPCYGFVVKFCSQIDRESTNNHK